MAETMEMSPLERAARAVADYTGQRLPPHGDIVTCEGIARAVLQAIRDPSEGMVEAGAGQIPTERDEDFPNAQREDAADCWAAMIDAALSE